MKFVDTTDDEYKPAARPNPRVNKASEIRVTQDLLLLRRNFITGV